MSTLDWSDFDLVLFDCDGVVYQGDEVLPGAIACIENLHEQGKKFRFITNTSTRSFEEMHKKFVRLGFGDWVKMSDCFHSGMAVAAYLTQYHCEVRRVFVVGGVGLVTELERAGIECLCAPGETMDESEFLKLANDETFLVDAVVVGYDLDFSFYKLAASCLCFQKNLNCLFIAANDDTVDRIGSRWLIPGNGPALAAIACATSALPNIAHPRPTIVGKPNKFFGDFVAPNVDPNRVLVVGDRLDTDIALATNCGFKSCLVLSGVSTLANVHASKFKPDFVASGLNELLSKS